MEPTGADGAPLDCIVVGAGPAGLSAALWLRKLGLRFEVLESAPRLGGELGRINLPIRDFLGMSARDGRDFLWHVETELAGYEIPVRFSTQVVSIDVRRLEVSTSAGTVRAKTLILAMGVRRRELEAHGVSQNLGRGVTYSGTRDLERLAGRPVAVVGGGDGAVENAAILADRCPSVWLLHRGAHLRARPSLARRLAQCPNVTVLPQTEILEVAGDGTSLTAVTYQTEQGVRSLAVPWLVVKVGFVPNTEELVGDGLERDPRGLLVVDRHLRTTVPGVFAVGDMTNALAPCIATAVGDGAMAAAAVRAHLE